MATDSDLQRTVETLRRELEARTAELTEARAERAATAEILEVINSSPADLAPVFEAILRNAHALCSVAHGSLQIIEDGYIRAVALHGIAEPLAERLRRLRTVAEAPMLQALLHGQPYSQVNDVRESDSPVLRLTAELQGARTLLSLPLRREEKLLGMIICARLEVRPFTEREISLLESFAAQAAIAIENARLFGEVQAKTRDIEEALRYQTGSSNILKVIASSPTDVQPVLQAIVESACELCGAYDAMVRLKGKGRLALSAHHGPLQVSMASLPVTHTSTAGLAVLDQKPVHVHDLLSSEGDQFPEAQDRARRFGVRTVLTVPLLREEESIGAILLRRQEVSPFSEKQIALLQTFADQAVIALGNVRLFEEVQAKTRDLSESLQQQTATADVLKVISRSVFDLQTVLDTLVESAYKLCGTSLGLLYLRGDEAFECKAIAGPGVDEASLYFKGRPIRAGRATSAERVIMTGEVQSITDFFADPEFDPKAKEIIHNAAASGSSLGALRSTLAVPMTRDGVVIGVLVIARTQTGEFPARQVELLQTFADQAVIAIENARLFDEVQARTRDLQESLQQQTATADVLKVISRSTFDLQAVLQALVESAAKLSDSDKATITRQRDGVFYRAETYGFSDEFMDYARSVPIVPDRSSATGRALIAGSVVHIPDVEADVDYKFREGQRLGDFRAVLAVPMLREGAPIGVIVLTRTEPRAYTRKQIELVTTFADQAAIAIENVRLFESVQARTRELAESLDDLRTAQDRLIQTEKLASLGQLTAGIAHEIKNPLNFVNNFSALSVELTDELNETLKQASLAGRLRAEVDELTGLLKDNLAKVVQHGKRADSIVKNMLLHSREGSGEHRPADINALVDESLNLAYHGARAEKPQFNVTLRRNLDPEAGMADVFPQEITRVFLNLLSNGFYAVTKRKADNGAGFEPVVSAMTKGRTDGVEIRIRDNGTGIPPEVKEKMFNPFFTTKPAGEGTGLGLSMSYDIIVKQHGGTIDVETLPGEFTEFTIVLPRTNLSKKN